MGGSDWSDTSESITSRLLVASDTLVNSFVNVSLYDIETRDSKINYIDCVTMVKNQGVPT